MLSAVAGPHPTLAGHHRHHHLSSLHSSSSQRIAQAADATSAYGPDGLPVAPVTSYAILTITVVGAGKSPGVWTATVTSDGSEPALGSLMLSSVIDTSATGVNKVITAATFKNSSPATNPQSGTLTMPAGSTAIGDTVTVVLKSTGSNTWQGNGSVTAP